MSCPTDDTLHAAKRVYTIFLGIAPSDCAMRGPIHSRSSASQTPIGLLDTRRPATCSSTRSSGYYLEQQETADCRPLVM
eukprot:5340615-Pleurochrysis_carterae.AAC.1